jgi:hypothetical protein
MSMKTTAVRSRSTGKAAGSASMVTIRMLGGRRCFID